MLLRFFDPLHLREVRNRRGPTESVLVLYLPDTGGKVESRSVRETTARSIKRTAEARKKKKKGGLKHTFCVLRMKKQVRGPAGAAGPSRLAAVNVCVVGLMCVKRL